MAASSSLAGRVREWLGDDRGTVYFEPEDDHEPLVLAAFGDVFELHAIAHFRWSSQAMTARQLRRRAPAYAEQARSALLQRIWRRARTLDPEYPTEAEQILNGMREVREGWSYPDGAGAIFCAPAVRVMLDPRLRQQRLAYQEREVRMREDHDLGRLRADQAGDLTDRWLRVVRELEALDELGNDERQFLVPYVAALSDPDLGRTMSDLAGARRARSLELANVLAQARQGHEQAGLFEFASAYDKALRAFCRQMGISPFS